MALVSYDYSDSSDYEDDNENKVETSGEVNELTLLGKNNIDELEDKTDISKEKAKESLLPPVEIKSNFNVVSWSLLAKNRTQPIRISVPSLEIDESVPETKPKLKPSSTKSGLFALLPKPKQQLLIPPSLNKKRAEKKKEIKPRTIISSSSVSNSTNLVTTSKHLNKAPVKNTSVVDDEEEDDDDEQPQSFFFLPHESPTEEVKVEIENADDLLKDISSNEYNLTLIKEDDNSEQSSSFEMQYPELPESSTDIELNKEALEKLCGRRGKRLAGDIEMVNVSGAELVGDSKLWLAKELTQQQVHFKRSKFDPMQRRKHQITFLAAHAREQELELSNQWANNRMTRKQTQAKYGF